MSQYYYNPFGNSSDVNDAREKQIQHAMKVNQEKKEIRVISLTMGCAIMAYLVIQILASSLLGILGLSDLYQSDTIFQYGFNMICISVCAVALPFGIMALINKKRFVSPVVPAENVKTSYAVAWVFFGLLCCVLANFVVSYFVAFIRIIFGRELASNDLSTPDSLFACVLQFIALAVVPAICEEFAMRCCCLQLLKKYGKGFAVFAVSIVFGLLHGNVIQFIFAFIVGAILGYVTVKTNNILPAIFIHMLNNGMSSVQTIFSVYFGEDKSETALVLMYALFAVLGVISGIYLLLKKQFKNNAKTDDSVLTNGQKFGAFLFPWMIIPFLSLILLTALTELSS